MPKCSLKWVFTVLLLACPALVAAAPAAEAKIQAFIVYKMIRFITWPSPPQTINLCALGSSDFSKEMTTVTNKKKIKGLNIAVIEQNADSIFKSQCHMLYLSNVDNATALRILNFLKEKPVLTISDREGFAQAGGIIGLYKNDKKIRFAINLKSSDRAGLKISSQLLNLATIIK